MILKLDSEIGCKSSGMVSSQSSLQWTNSCKSIFMEAVIGETLPVRSNISDTFEAQCLWVNFDGMMLMVLEGLFPQWFLAKLNSPILIDSISSLKNHFIPLMRIIWPSSVSVLGGSSPENETPFRLNPPLLRTISNSPARWCARSIPSTPVMQSSTYIVLDYVIDFGVCFLWEFSNLA